MPTASATVIFTGTDHKEYSETVEASSAYDAANKAMKKVALLWWWNPAAPITVNVGEKTYRVSPSKVIEWRNAKAKPLTTNSPAPTLPVSNPASTRSPRVSKHIPVS